MDLFPLGVWHYLAGGLLVGAGGGLACGLCPRAALASLGIGNWPVLLGLGAMFLGAYAQGRLAPQGAPEREG